MRLTWSAFRRRLFQVVREAGFADLSEAEYLLFRYPSIENLRPSRLAEDAGLSKQAVNDLIRQLEAKGYLELVPDPSDGRAKLIKFKPRGAEFQQLLATHSQQIAGDWARQLGRKRYESLLRSLESVLEYERNRAGGPPR